MSVPVQANPGTIPTAEASKLLYPEGNQQATASPADAAAATPVSDDVSRQEPTVDFFRDAFLRTRGIVPTDQQGEATSAGDKQEQTNGGAASSGSVQTSVEGVGSQAQPASSDPAKSDSGLITLTPEELARRAQSEADRIIAKRNHDERIRRDKEEEERLLNTNPFEYAERVKKKKAEEADLDKVREQASTAALSTARAYDTTVIDPIVLALPEDERNRIIASIDNLDGLPGRGTLITKSLQSLQALWKGEALATARETLLKDPSFIKEIMTRYGGQVPEPDHIPSDGAPLEFQSPEAEMNGWIRGAANQVRGRARG